MARISTQNQPATRFPLFTIAEEDRSIVVDLYKPCLPNSRHTFCSQRPDGCRHILPATSTQGAPTVSVQMRSVDLTPPSQQAWLPVKPAGEGLVPQLAPPQAPQVDAQQTSFDWNSSAAHVRAAFIGTTRQQAGAGGHGFRVQQGRRYGPGAFRSGV